MSHPTTKLYDLLHAPTPDVLTLTNRKLEPALRAGELYTVQKLMTKGHRVVSLRVILDILEERDPVVSPWVKSIVADRPQDLLSPDVIRADYRPYQRVLEAAASY